MCARVCCAIVGLAVALGTPDASAQEDDPLVFIATRIELAYAADHPRHPDLDDIRATTSVTLVEVDNVLYAPGEAPEPERWQSTRERTLALDELGLTFVAHLDASAVRAISRAIVRAFADRGIGAVRVGPDPEQIDATGDDMRFGTMGPLRMIVRTGRITDLRTVGVGDRLPEDAIDHPAHERFRERSPVRPAGEEDAGEARRDLLFAEDLDDFLARINRHRGRFARAVVRRDETPDGDLALDLVISEAKPWTIYAQLSDTGTEATGDLRYRLGLIHNQLTGNDDTLSISYVRGELDTDPDFQALVGSYEAPVGSSERFRWRVFGSWSEFSAAELGQREDAFLGETGVVGAELIANIAQFDELFLDLEAGFRYEDIQTENRPALLSGSESLLIGRVGLTAEKFTLTDELVASLGVEFADASLTGADELGLTLLGRIDPAEEWAILTFDGSYSFYLEPLIDRAGWQDPTTPESSTLAHEIALRASGQWALDHRLIPQQRGVVGGLYSVRGYPESVVAGDSSLVLSAEYRFHLPRVFGVQPDPRATPLFGRPFRVAPSQVYGAPDWDLVLKGFVDVGRVWQSDELDFENGETLASVGVGLEVALRNNVSFRLDYAVALSDVEPGGRESREAGEGELHFALTVAY